MPRKETYSAETNLAWARHWRERSCPPLSLLGKGMPNIEKHLEICSDCRERLFDDLFSRERKPVLVAHGNRRMPRKTENPRIGEIRRVLKDAEMEDIQGEYYNRPLVIVLEASAQYGFVKVAQLHREACLASPNDITLSPHGEEGDPFFSYFAESWNCYPVRNEYLGPVLGKVPSNVVKEILRNESLSLPDVDDDTPIEAFRELEIDVAHHFAIKSFLQSYNELTAKGVEDSSILDDMKRIAKDIPRSFKFAASLAVLPFLGPVMGVAGAAMSTAFALATGTLAMVAGLITAGTITAEILEKNLKIKSKSEDKAYSNPSREQEYEFIERKNVFLRNAESLKATFGTKVPVEQQRALLEDSSLILGSLEGNSRGLRDNGDTPSADAQKAIVELRSFHKKVGLAEAA